MTTTRATFALTRTHPVASPRSPLQPTVVTKPPSQPGDSPTSVCPGDIHVPASARSPLQQGRRDGLLNVSDALSFVDSVKLQFAEQPEVYDEFLGIMKDFKFQLIDHLGVMERVSELFHCHPTLIQGFNAFCPPGYWMEASCGVGPNAVVIITPAGSAVYNPTTRRFQRRL
ncbi:hypothetical protein GSI_10885 [Ganoderma sinense ZZ0214-1]|uniref:Uncharacterized protein n=1 Tax=Ganoderma sinense ZZ0214-1 TaxID=1077348 RepID=A0A2G8S1U7_9APHY|nr:hypothetical protein GSI_10885 [Ganoderma sinense ZZ0214-1]